MAPGRAGGRGDRGTTRRDRTGMNVDAAIHPYGDAALVVEFGDQITEDAYRRIRG
ncbi:MAG: hypothetical protein MZU95_09195 [Desulfomicrobium escambiense]|nr:hypothetical protein [Desulfomicrobium escambiense]